LSAKGATQNRILLEDDSKSIAVDKQGQLRAAGQGPQSGHRPADPNNAVMSSK